MIGSWKAIVSADPGNRYCGVGIFLSPKLRADVSHCVWLPGRILHVRCETPLVTLDIVNVYQWAVDHRKPQLNESRRQQIWLELSKLLQGLPRRNQLLLGMDANATCRPLAGLVGRGVPLAGQKGASEDVLQLLQVNQLVLLNTWKQSRKGLSHTFLNNGHRTQIDFLATRRYMADPQARQAVPVALDLTPWRFGPKHRPVCGTIPWKAGWMNCRCKTLPQPRRKAQQIREALRSGSERIVAQLRTQLELLVESATGKISLGALNRKALTLASAYLCPEQLAPPPGRATALHVAVKPHIQAMWAAHRRLKERVAGTLFQRVFDAFRRFRDFSVQSRRLRSSCRKARRDRLEAYIDEAQQAANRQDMGAIYRVIRHLAPKNHRLPPRIRSEGQLLSGSEQFTAIMAYFGKVYDSPDPLPAVPSGLDLCLTVDEVRDAVDDLKAGKSVPDGSLPAELWRLCPDAFAKFLHAQIGRGVEGCLPPEVSECQLSLLPKPGKRSRLPKDLRPLGIQDPGAKNLRHRPAI